MSEILCMEEKLQKDIKFAIENVFKGQSVFIFKKEQSSMKNLFAIDTKTKETLLVAELNFSLNGCHICFMEPGTHKDKKDSSIKISFHDYKQVKNLEEVIREIFK